MAIPNHLYERLLSICGTPEDRDTLIQAIESGGGDLTADEIAYDNTDSGLSAAEVQAAIDELASTGPDLSEYLKKDGSVAITGDLVPDTSGSRSLGSVLKPFNQIMGAEVIGMNGNISAIKLSGGNEGGNMGYLTSDNQLKIIVNTGDLRIEAQGINFSGPPKPIHNVEDPSLAQDAATKNYVDTVVTGASGSFTSQDGKTITVVNGLITSIV